MYKVVVTEHAQKNLANLRKYGKQTLAQLRRVLGGLETDPYGLTQPLHAPLQAYRSLHSGRFRAVVKIVEDRVQVVYVVGVGWHESGSRDDIYQRVKQAIEAGVIEVKRKSLKE